jgi:hypothetical protein
MSDRSIHHIKLFLCDQLFEYHSIQSKQSINGNGKNQFEEQVLQIN